MVYVRLVQAAVASWFSGITISTISNSIVLACSTLNVSASLELYTVQQHG